MFWYENPHFNYQHPHFSSYRVSGCIKHWLNIHRNAPIPFPLLFLLTLSWFITQPTPTHQLIRALEYAPPITLSPSDSVTKPQPKENCIKNDQIITFQDSTTPKLFKNYKISKELNIYTNWSFRHWPRKRGNLVDFAWSISWLLPRWESIHLGCQHRHPAESRN